MKSNFEERKQNRLEAFENLAEKNEQSSKELAQRSSDMASVIPFGQPILVGHHSEKRDRNYREKIHNTMGKAVEASNKAEYYRQRAESLLNGTAISSDDPNAIDKLEEKLDGLLAAQELYKSINKVIRSKSKEKVSDLVALGIKEETAKKLLVPDFANRIGIPSYKLTNNNGVIKNTRDRIEHLKRTATIESGEREINNVRIVVSQEDNRVQLFFPGKPNEEVRKLVKSHGFHWAHSLGCWMRLLSSHAVRYAKDICSSDLVKNAVYSR